MELLPDGEFHYVMISNQPRLTTRCQEDKVDDGEGSCGALSFYARIENNNKIIMRKLGMKTDTEDFTYRMFGFNKPIEEIEFDGKFPTCDIKYNDSALPVNISLKAVAPFVPHNSDLSATPGFYTPWPATASALLWAPIFSPSWWSASSSALPPIM